MTSAFVAAIEAIEKIGASGPDAPEFRKDQEVMLKLGWVKEDFADCSGKIDMTDDEFASLPTRAKARITRCHNRSGTFDVKLLEQPGGFRDNVEASQIDPIASGIA